jgi:hypothetical protein
VLSKLGEDKIFEIVDGARSELSLGEQEPAWRLACKHIAAWASDEIAAYRDAKS